MKCPNCGSMNGESEKFCEICGASLETETKAALSESEAKPAMPAKPAVSAPQAPVAYPKPAAPAIKPVIRPVEKPQPPPANQGSKPRKKPGKLVMAGSAAAILIASFAILNLAGGGGGSATKSPAVKIDLKAGEYKGETVGNKPDGEGVYIFGKESPFDYYSGEFVKGEMDGNGLLQYKPGEIENWIDGEFSHGLPNGEANASYNINFMGQQGGPYICDCAFKDGLLDGLFIERSEDGEYAAIGRFENNSPVGIWFIFLSYETEITDSFGTTWPFAPEEPIQYDADLGGYDFREYKAFDDYYDELPGLVAG
ncbi:MAG: hypothetical protein LBC41_13775 [Clostridiales bacterium]|nr:hypothetical protein [Clostridiales bacterium]